MEIDLFGNKVEQKQLTSMQRISSRQVVIEGRDLYTTEPRDIERFLKVIEKEGEELKTPIWEPAAGRGDISKTLIKNGYEVRSSDIYEYRDSEIDILQADFMLCKNCKDCKTIFTNPPFNMQEQFLEHALSFGVDVIFFVRLSFLSSIRRYKIYQMYKPKIIYIYVARAHCYKNGDVSKGQNMIDYCLIWWEPPYTGTYKNKPVMEWIL